VPVQLSSICTVGNLNVYYLPEILEEVDRLGLKCFINHVHGPEYYDIKHLPAPIKTAIANKLEAYPDRARLQFILNMLQAPEKFVHWDEFKFWTKNKDAYRNESFAKVCPEYYEIIKEYDKDF
jgi:hypothetical protein